MQTILDDARMWLLHAVIYQNDLRLVLAEMHVGEKASELPAGISSIEETLLRNTTPIEVREDSRLIAVRFPQVVAWQVVDESFTTWDEYEVRDDTGVVQILTRSRYFDYVLDNHGWFRDTIGPAKMYRVWTANEVVDVVACEPPKVEPWEPGT